MRTAFEVFDLVEAMAEHFRLAAPHDAAWALSTG